MKEDVHVEVLLFTSEVQSSHDKHLSLSLQKHGHSPLYHAAKQNCSETIALLLEWGADVNHYSVSARRDAHILCHDN